MLIDDLVRQYIDGKEMESFRILNEKLKEYKIDENLMNLKNLEDFFVVSNIFFNYY